MISEQANLLGFGNPMDIGIIAAVVVLLFGGSKLGNFGKQLGEGIKEFKKGSKEAMDEGSAPVSQAVAAPVAPVQTAVAAPPPASSSQSLEHTPEAPKGTQQ